MSEEDGEQWWSLDVNADSIILQRSRDRDAVNNKFGGKERKNVTPIISNWELWGSIKNYFAILWAICIIQEKSQKFNLKLPPFLASLTKRNSVDVMEMIKHFHDRNPALTDLILILKSVPYWPPMLLAVYLGNAKLFDQNFESTVKHKFLPLHLATVLFPNKTEMVFDISWKTTTPIQRYAMD